MKGSTNIHGELLLTDKLFPTLQPHSSGNDVLALGTWGNGPMPMRCGDLPESM